MPLVILQPCANKESREHYNDTIKNSVDLNVIKSFLVAEDYDALGSIYPSSEVKAWGVTPGKRKSTNIKKWEKIQAGDVTLLAAKGRVFASAITTYKIHNPDLAKYLWGTDTSGQTWEYIYFVSEITAQNIPYQELNSVIPYAENYVIQGFTVLDEQKSNNVLEAFELFSVTFYPEINIDQNFDFFKELESLETTSKSSARKEQSILRRLLFKNRPIGTCCICNNDYPVSFLVAAHIKKRSKCTLNEKKDFENIVVPMCKFGCDDLYEKGYIGIDQGKIIKIQDKLTSDAINRYLDHIVGNSCHSWSDSTEGYFSWHINHHKKST